MSILVDEGSRVLVQGITGRVGRAQTEFMVAEGTRVGAGVTPGRGGTEVCGVPVFDSVAQAQQAEPADVALLFVPPLAAEGAALEALECGIRLLVLITEGVPVHATMRLRARAAAVGARLVGPATPGVISPGRCKVGIMPGRFFARGPVGLVSRSGTLSYEVSGQLTAAGLGQSTVVGLGADPVVGMDITDLLALFEADPQTRVVVLVGEVGGTQEERAASYARDHMSKPVVAYVAGRCAVSGVPMGHAGALVRGGTGTAAEKTAALESAGVGVAPRPGDVVGLVQAALARQQPDRAAARTEDAPAKRHKVALSVHINADLCKGTEGCGLCLAVCEEEVLAAAPKMNSRGVHAVTVADPGPCTGCGLCVLHCPDLAMWLRPRGEIPEAIAR